MSFNTVITSLPTGFNDLDVAIGAVEPPPTPAPVQKKRGKTFLWTVHPKRRLNAYRDTKRKRLPFRALSRNNDFRAWRRIVEYAGTVIKGLLRCEMTYAEIKATGLTYAEIKATGLTYDEIAHCEPILT